MNMKKHRIIKSVIVFEVILIILMLFGGQNPSVLVIDVHGEIASEHLDYYRTDFWGYSTNKVSGEKITNILRQYENDKDIKAFILDIDSNGGDGFGQEVLVEQIRSMKKPVVSVVRDQALSSGYYVASATKWIFANELSNIADIGHVSIIEYSKDNINFTKCHISSSKFKRMYYDDCSYFERTAAYVQDKERLIELTKVMARDIAAYRNLSEGHILNLADGTIFVGIGALKLGLIDQIGGLHDAVDWLEQELGMELKITYYRELAN
jgi:protease IV